MTDLPEMSPHRIETNRRLTSIGKRLFKYVEFDDDEEFITEIRKHPIGLVFIWITGGFIIAVTALVSIVLSMNLDTILTSSSFSTGDNSPAKALILFVGLLLSGLSLLMTSITGWLYTSNVIFITSEKIAEVRYVSIFHRKVMQMNIGKVEDITVEQRGILPRIFNFGNLLVETAGETSNPAFTYVPMPNRTSQLVLQAHENYVEKYGN